jgi:CRP/FNR family cyclic AMP-dependent transcriptional regulator
VEGQLPRGVFLLCTGKVKLSTSSRDGKVLILKMAGPGEMLGLSAVISGGEYELTAETAMPCQVNYVAREPLMDLLQRHGEAGLRSAQALSREFQAAYRDIHDLILARWEAGQVAAFLDTTCQQWCERNPGQLRTHSRRNGADDWCVA